MSSRHIESGGDLYPLLVPKLLDILLTIGSDVSHAMWTVNSIWKAVSPFFKALQNYRVILRQPKRVFCSHVLDGTTAAPVLSNLFIAAFGLFGL